MPEMRQVKLEECSELFFRTFGLDLEGYIDNAGIFNQQKFRRALNIHPSRNLTEYIFDNYSFSGRRLILRLVRY